MAETSPPPVVDPSALRAIAPGVWVIADRRVPLVPNIGIIVGERTVLVIDTGMGRANGARVLNLARELAPGLPIIATLTHFHPEHGYGAEPFKGAAHILYNRAQADDLSKKGEGYLAMFRGMGPAVAEALEDTQLVDADETYSGASHRIDLGGKTAVLHTWGRAHTNGDQVVFLEEDRILFSGDLAEEATFPIFPWFPPDDADIDAEGWVRALDGCLALDPAIVVPGHGEVGDARILRDVRAYILAIDAKVAQARAKGFEGETLLAELRPQVLAEHPDWHFPEWIDFAVRYFAERTVGARA